MFPIKRQSRQSSKILRPFIKKQSGIALLVILLIVATVSAIATQMHWQHRLSVRRISNLQNLAQAREFAKGGENWVREILLEDLRSTTTDNLNEDWAISLPPLPIEGGAIQGRIYDQQAKFNVNNLIDPEGNINTNALEQFRRLLLNLEIEPDIANAIADWLDGDNYPEFPGGAEDSTYSSLNYPYRTANHYITDISELMAIQGIDKVMYPRLRNFLCALPIDTAININTASAEVLLSISDKLSLSDVENVLQTRESNPFESINEFFTINQLDPNVETALLDTQSEYFLSEIEVVLLERLYRRHTYLYRDLQTGSISAYQRIHSPDALPVNEKIEELTDQSNTKQSQL